MSTEENVSLVQQHYNAFNSRDFGRVATLVEKNVEWINIPFGTTDRGPEGSQQALKRWTAAISDFRVDLINLVASGDWVVAEYSGKGNHNAGSLVVPAGPIAPTGKSIDLLFCEAFKVKSGKIALARLYFDAATLMRQLGLLL